MVSASHNPADDNGLKVLDADGLKLDDAIEDELEQLIWREGELGGVAQRAGSAGRSTPARCSTATATHRLGAGGDRSTPAACTSCSTARTGRAAAVGPDDPRGDRRPGRRRSMPSRTGSTSTSTAGRPHPASLAAAVVAARRRRRVRARRRRRPADRGRRDRRRSSTATRSWASSRSTGSTRRPAGRRPGRVGPLERRAAGGVEAAGGQVVRTPSATSTSSRGCRSRAPSSAARRAAT